MVVPAGSSTGDKHRIKGKGVEHPNTARKGDMYVILKVVIPKKVSKEQKKLIDELAKTNLEDASEIKEFYKYL